MQRSVLLLTHEHILSSVVCALFALQRGKERNFIFYVHAPEAKARRHNVRNANKLTTDLFCNTNHSRMAHIGFSARNFGAICRRSNIFRHSIRYVTTNNSSQNRRVLLIGSGNVVPPVVEYLGASSVLKPTVTIGSIDERAANSLAEKHERVSATYLDVSDEVALNKCVADHDAVISLVPWIFHGNVARACIANKVDMITTSYVSAEMESLHERYTC